MCVTFSIKRALILLLENVTPTPLVDVGYRPANSVVPF